MRRGQAMDQSSRNPWCQPWPQWPWGANSAIAARRVQTATPPVHAEMIVDGGARHRIRPQPQLRRGLLHGEMRDFGAENAELASLWRQAGLLCRPFPVLLQESIAG